MQEFCKQKILKRDTNITVASSIKHSIRSQASADNQREKRIHIELHRVRSEGSKTNQMAAETVALMEAIKLETLG